MSESKPNTGPVKPSRGWLRKVAWIAGSFVLLLVITYFVVTSGGFVKSVVLPKVGAALNAEVTAADIGLSPFSQLVLRDLKVTPKGKDTLLTAQLVRTRYSLMSILSGNIAVAEVTVESPAVTLIENADGTSNLDPLMQGQPAAKPKTAAAASAPPKLDIKSVALKNASVKRIKTLPGGGREVVELSGLNITLADLKNPGSGKLELTSALAFENSSTNAAGLAAKLTGSFGFDLTADLQPARFNGKANLTIEKATGAFSEVAALGATLDTEASPTEIKQLTLSFTQGGARLGEVRVNGPFDATKSEGKLNVAVLSLDRRVLNLAGAASGIDFGTTVVNSTNVIELSKAGAVITAVGQLDAARVAITRQKQTTPTLDFRCDYAVTVDNTGKSALLQKLNLTGTQNNRPLLQTELTSPMTISFGGANASAGDAALNIDLSGLNLADWRAFAADLAPAGMVNARIKLLSQAGGKRLQFDLDGGVTGLGAKFGSNAISQADVKLAARGVGVDLKQFTLEDYRVELAQGGEPALTLSGQGTFDSATQDADLQLALRATITRLLTLFPQPDAALTGGSVELTGRVASKAQNQTVTGRLALTGLSGKFSNFKFASFGTTSDLDLGMKGSQLDIRKAAGELREGTNAGGQFDVSGNFDTARKAGKFALKLANFNQAGLRPFLESALGDKTLVSVTLNSSATVALEANGDASAKADLQLANLVVSDPKGALPKTPLELKAQFDAAVAKQVAKIAQCQLTLTPTDRAKNEVKLTGTVDFSKTNAIAGNLKLAADSLDVTRYYNLFAGGTKPAAQATPPPSATTEREADPIKLPFANFTFDAGIGKFFLREVEATNFQFVAKLDGTRVLIKPAELSLNGAPLSATVDLDLSVPGYKYDVTLNGKPVPLTPIVNSFMPERKDQFHGVTLANAQIKGVGTTGSNLRKNLTGQFAFASTNLGLSISNVRNPTLYETINAIVGIPDLIRNPGQAVGNLLAGLLGRRTQGGFADEITAHPIESVMMQGRVANGQVSIEQADIRSASFQVTTTGTIALADVLTNSTINFPIHVSLSRQLAERVGLAGNTPTNQPMAALPDFLTMKGTMGKPQKDINAMVLVALAAKGGVGVANQFGNASASKVGGLLDVIGGALQPVPQTAPTTNPPPALGTNAPATNAQPQPVNLLDLFKKPKK